MGTYIVVDGNSLTYRAFFALPTDMATAAGQVTNAVFGFTSMLINVLKDHKPDGVLVTFDRPEPTFRHDAEPEYKAQRTAAPDILRQQMGLVREVLDAIGITTIDLAGWEADDLIATAVDLLVDAGHDVIIVTGDRDSYQLVADPHVKVLYNRRGVSDYALYDEAGIVEKTGVTPALYPQYAALRGDTSDNLPGVPGVGEKTAAKLITTYGGLDGIFANVDAQTPKLKASLIEHESRARKNLDLMVLRHDAPLAGVTVDGLGVDPNPEELQRLFDFLEFRTLGARLAEALGGMGTSLDIADGEDRQELVAEVRVVDARCRGGRSHRGSGHARRGGCLGRRTRKNPGERAGDRDGPGAGRGRLDPRGTARRRSRGDRARRPPRHQGPQRQTVDAIAAGGRGRRRGSDARHGDRRLSDRPRRGPLHAARPDREVHAVRPSVRRGHARPARPRRHVDERRRTRRA